VKVFVLGGTGAIGKPAVAALVAAGHDVTALARTPEKAALIRDLGAEPVEVSMFDVVALTEALADHDAVANLASAMPSTSQFMRMRAWRETQRVRTEGSAAVVDAALAAGVRTLIQESVSMLYADHGSSWVDEGAPVDHYPMAIGNHAAEASAHRFTAAGQTGVILRSGLFYGPGARHSREFVMDLDQYRQADAKITSVSKSALARAAKPRGQGEVPRPAAGLANAVAMADGHA
jgi:nucleoside-diphosphate-sugar epimerase